MNKRDKFLKLAPERTNRILRRMDELATCAAYSYSEEEARQILDALQGRLDLLEQQFVQRNKQPGFFKLQPPATKQAAE